MRQPLLPRLREAGSRAWLRVLLAALLITGVFGINSTARAAETISAILGTVFYDSNANGSIDAGDAVAPGVTVMLTDANGAAVLDADGIPVAPFVTNDNGRYAFFNIKTDKTYRVVEVPPAGYAANAAVGPIANVVKESNNVLQVATPTPTGASITFDGNQFLLVPPVQIAGYVYIDTDGPLVISAGDVLLSNPSVVLKGDFNGDGVPDTANAVVDVTGHYTFASWTNPDNGQTQLIPPGAYQIVQTVPSGYSALNAFPGRATDVKLTTTSLQVAATTPNTLYDNENFLIGTGLSSSGGPGSLSISGFVWYDLNGDGLRAPVNPVDPGLGGTTVKLTGTDIFGFTVTLTTTTAADGSYTFQNLNAGTYVVSTDKTTLPAGIDTETFDGIGAIPDGLLDNRVLGVLTALNSPVSNVNFGYTGRSSLGDTVWYDVNGNGVQESTEKGIAGVTVNLVWAGPDGTYGTADDVVYPAQFTDVNGKYSFTRLPAGNFKVLVDSASPSLSTFLQTYDLDGLASPNSALITNLAVGQNRSDADFGYWQAASVCGTLYFDKNNNSSFDTGEGIAGLTVTLQTSAGVVIATTVTDANGKYSFPRVKPGSYVVVAPQAGGGGGIVTTNPLSVTLTAGQHSKNNDFRYKANGKISGTVTCADDTCGAMSGVVVALKDSAGNTLATATTDSSGKYAFKNLPAGIYTVSVPSLVSGLAISGSSSATLLLAAGSTLAQNFTYKGGTISGYVFNDTKGDGTKGSDDTGVAGVTVTLRDCYGNTQTDVTDSNGYYRFSGCDLKAGAYTVSVPSSCNGKKWTTSTSRTITLSAGGTVSNINFGVECNTACVSGTLYYDSNCNNRIDSNDWLLQGLTVKLTNNTTHVVLTTTTDCNGKYTFKSLPAGSYKVQVPSAVCNCLSAYATSQTFTLTSGQCVTKDFRYYWNNGCGNSGCGDDDDDGDCGHH